MALALDYRELERQLQRADNWLWNNRNWLPAMLLLPAAIVGMVLVSSVPNDMADISPWLLLLGFAVAFLGLGVLLALPILSLVSLVFIQAGLASATLHIYYGLPLPQKYLWIAVLGGLLVLWIRRSRHWLVPAALQLPPQHRQADLRAFWTAVSLLLVYMASLQFSRIYAFNQSLAIKEWDRQFENLATCIAIALAIGACGRFSSLRWMTRIALAGLSLSVLLAVLGTAVPSIKPILPGFTLVLYSTEPGSVGDRIAGNFGHPNTLGRYCVFGLPIALALFWVERGFFRIFAVACALVLLIGLVGSESRGAVLVLLMMLVPALWYIRSHVRVAHVLGVLVLGSVALAIAWQNVDTERVERTIIDFERMILRGEQPTDAATRGRLSEMFIAWEVWKDHPVIGIGLANYEHRFQMNSFNAGTKLYNSDRAAHSFYLETMAERGLVGLLIYFVSLGGVLVTVFSHARRHMESYPVERTLTWGLCAAFVSYQLSALFLHDVHAETFWALVGLMIASTKYNSNRRETGLGAVH